MPTRAALAGAARPTAAGVQLRVDLSTLLGLDEHPADLPGYGPVPARQARHMAETYARGRWCWAVLDPDGHAVDADLLRTRPLGWPRHARTCRAVVEILVPADLLTRLTGQAPGVDPDLLALWRPVITAIARDHARTADKPTCDPTRRLATARLRRQIQTGHVRCTWPGCRRPARDCDIDHTHDHAHGGATTGENLKPLCKKHHALKTDHGWRTRDTGPHSYQLRAPNGTRHHVDLPPAREPHHYDGW